MVGRFIVNLREGTHHVNRLTSFIHSKMETSGTDKIPTANSIVVEDSETTVEIKIKTLDSQTYTLRVNKCVPVPALKEQIATVTGVLSDQQRLICRGRVLKDDQLLSAYHVEDGHTLHLVVRQPHQSSPPFIVSEGAPINPDSMPTNSNQVSRTIVLEAFNTSNIDSASLNRLMANILNSLGASDNASDNVQLVANVREANSERLSRPLSDTGPSDTQNQQNITSQRINSDRQQEAFRYPSSASLGPQNLPEIPHSLTTLRQYLAHLKNEFRREIPSSNDRDRSISGEASAELQNGRDNVSQSLHSSRRDDLPTPAALAEILQSTRQLLAEHAEECLLGLARELEDDASVTAYLRRLNVQSSAIRTGFFLQNLGSLLLELGRTTMTLRMGQGPTEAVVNSGPALFISASGPNPVVVQPVPFYPAPNFGGMHFGSTNSGHGPEGERVASSVLPRNIDIRIHTVPISAAGQSGLGSAQLQQENLNSVRTPAIGESVHEAVQTQPHGATLAGEYGFRVVPVRTVVAMPAGINNSQSDLSGNLIPLLHPLLARIRQQNTGSVNSTLRPQAFPFHQGTAESNQEPSPDSVRQILESYTEGSVQEETQVPSYTVPVVSETGLPLTAQIEQHGDRVYITSQIITPNGYSESSSHVNDRHDVSHGSLPQFLGSFNQSSTTILRGEQTGDVDQQVSDPGPHTEQSNIDRDAVLNEASRSVNDQGVLFSNFLRQLLPLLPHGMSVAQDDSSVYPNPLNIEARRMNSSDPSSSQHQRDPPESPNSKRHRRE